MNNLKKDVVFVSIVFDLTELWAIPGLKVLKPKGTILIFSSSFQHSTDHESVATTFPEISLVTCSSENQMENTLFCLTSAHGNW